MSSMLLIALSTMLTQAGYVETIDGFTGDGAWLVGSSTENNVFEGESRFVYYQSTSTGEMTSFDTREDDLPEFNAWLEKHPVTAQPIDGRTSPDGLVTIDIVLERAGARAGGWSADATWRVLARWKDRTRFLTTFSNSTRLEISWAPNSRAVLVRSHSNGTMTGIRGAVIRTTNDSSSLFPLELPVINVAGRNGKTTTKVITGLPRGPRYVPSNAVKKREATVVYFAPGQEPRARTLLPHLPGATLAPLDWAAPFDVVVALGDR